MRIKNIGILLLIASVILCLQAASGGRAANGGMDKTGAPNSFGTCGGYCHNSTGLHPNTQFNILMKDANGQMVTTYVPGQTYTLECTVTSDGSPAGYGMQAVILDSLNLNAGDLLNVSTSETQLTTISNGREFLEHQGISSTGVFVTTWEAPSVGTGIVTVYGVGIAVDGSGSEQGDDFAQAVPLLLSEEVTNSIAETASKSHRYTLYPNPSSGAFFIKNNSAEKQCIIKVYNLIGQTIYQEHLTIEKEEHYKINLNQNLDLGLYWVEIEHERGKESYPISIY